MANWFLQDIDIHELPIFPHIHKGEHEKIRFYKYDKKNQSLIVVRLWQSIYRLKQNSPSLPLWFGSVSSMVIRERLGLKYLVTKKEDITNIAKLFQDESMLIKSKIIKHINEEKKQTIYLLYQKSNNPH